jgi:hypothetical protein
MRFLKTEFFALFLVLSYNSFAQVTFISNGNCTNLTSTTCWIKTGTCSFATNPNDVVGTASCPVIIEINHTESLS